MDMAGTIYEWCLNAFADPGDTGFPGGGEDLRVLRGGSWGHSPDSARSASRYRGNPNFRFNHVGFRVVCSSPIFDH